MTRLVRLHPGQFVFVVAVVAVLTAIGIWTNDTRERQDSVERVVQRQETTVVRSFCIEGITPACERKAYTLIRGCLANPKCRALLIEKPFVPQAKKVVLPSVPNTSIPPPASQGGSGESVEDGSGATGSPSPGSSGPKPSNPPSHEPGSGPSKPPSTTPTSNPPPTSNSPPVDGGSTGGPPAEETGGDEDPAEPASTAPVGVELLPSDGGIVNAEILPEVVKLPLCTPLVKINCR